jgi:DNA/RNA endonuclease YhcR with UshA esterase domain
MKKIISKFLILLITVFSLFSCGDDKKSEFVDENTKSADLEVKKKEPQKEIESENINDSNVNNNSVSDKQKKNYNSFNYEDPVAVISPLDAGDYTGKTVTVKGFVADIYQSEKVAYLNFVEKYPDNPFTGVIFASKFDDFPDISKFKNKNVELTGRVSVFKGKPQIILNSPKQIVVK